MSFMWYGKTYEGVLIHGLYIRGPAGSERAIALSVFCINWNSTAFELIESLIEPLKSELRIDSTPERNLRRF
jgi:hypothetical protein